MSKFPHKDLTSLDRLTASEFHFILEHAENLKKQYKETGKNEPTLQGKVLAMVFEKASLRTRVTFEVGMLHLGGQAIYLSQTNFKLGERESVYDVAKNLERWVDGIMLRTFLHDNIVTMAENSSVPVINGLSDTTHPCQALADLLTFKEHLGSFKNKKMVFVGDGNNVAASLAYACAHAGMEFVCASPGGYLLPQTVIDTANRLGAENGAVISATDNYIEAVKNAHCIYTDVWTSMGQESEKEKRLKDFAKYQVNSELLKTAASDAIVLHCLPAHRGEEITDEVMDGPQSAVFDQAENRLHAQKAVLDLLMG